MDIYVNDIKDNLTVIDKDNLIHAKGKEVLNIDIVNNNINNNFLTTIKIISCLVGLTDDEYKIYEYFILDSIAKGYNMEDSTIIEINNNMVNILSNKLLVSKSTIYRNITNLVNKGIIDYLRDTKGIPVNGKYIFKDNYNVSKYRNQDIKVITITLKQ